MKTIHRNTRSKSRMQKRQCRAFPYQKVAAMWEQKMKISQIAKAIKRVDKHNPGDPYHSLRNFLYRMHNRGYVNEHGQTVKLPRRVSSATVRKSRKAGLRAG